MLQKIIHFSIQNKLIIGLFTLALIAAGIYSLIQLPIDAVPDITNNQVQIITSTPSLGATDVERLITYPIEQANANIPGLHEMRSFSRFGLSLVTIVFEEDIDIYWARQQVAERLQMVQRDIPSGIGNPSIAPVTTGLGEIYQYVIKPKKGYEHQYNPMELRTIQDWLVRRQLLGVKGIADVSSFGGFLKQYEIAIESHKINSLGISIQDITSALEKNNQNTGGAYIEKGPTIQFIRSEGLVKNKTDIEDIVVKTDHTNSPIRIRDIAEVKIGKAIRYGALTHNYGEEVSGGIVMMLKGANSSTVIKDVKNRIEQIKKTLPVGVEIVPFLDRTKMVDNAIHTVEKNLIEGALIVIFILILFLGNIRAGLLTASVIPLSMLFAITMMHLFNVSGNLMSLGAIDFGLIVDGAVIIVEAVMHNLYNKGKQMGSSQISQDEMNHIVEKSSSKMMNAAIFGQVIILIVYLPIFALQGIEGKMFVPMAQTVTFALIGAFILSVTYVPMAASLFLNKKVDTKKNWNDRLMEKIENQFEKIQKFSFEHSKKIVIGVLFLFVISVVLLMRMGGEFIPTLEEGDFALETRVLSGSNLNTTIDVCKKGAKVLLDNFEEVEQVVGKIGSGEIPTDPMPIEAADLMIILKDKSEWKNAQSFDELEEKMSEKLESIPGVTFGFQFPVQMRFNELMTGAKQEVVCKIYGENLDSLVHYAHHIGKMITTIKGTKDLYVEPVSGTPQIVITPNRNNLAQFGLSMETVNLAINTAFAGSIAGNVFEGEKKFDMVLRLNENQRTDIEDVRNLLISTPNGIQIPLNKVANVDLKESISQIQREDSKRRIIVGFNAQDRDVESIVNELQEKVNREMKFATGYYVKYGGSFENLQEAKKRLGIALPIALMLIFVLLFFAFGSVVQGLLIYTAIPLSAIGGILFLTMRGMPFSISAGIGFIALFGVSVLNGIVLISEFNSLYNSGMRNWIEIATQGTKNRLRPVLMTAAVASLGFIPMALSNGAGAEVQRPLATVVIGGLITATFLTLFVLPIFYVMVSKRIKTKHIATLAIVFLFLSNNTLRAQGISLQAAIDSANNSYIQLQTKKLNTQYYESLYKTANIIPKTNISSEFGQFNSAVFDSKFGISQSLNSPLLNHNQKEIYRAERELSDQKLILNAVDLNDQVIQVYYAYLVLLEKEKLYKWADSIYTQVNQKSNLKYNIGESNILEKTSSENQLVEIKQKINEVQSNLLQKRIVFNYLLHSQNLYPQSNDIIYNHNSYKNNWAHQYPQIKLLEKNKELIERKKIFEKSSRLPDISIGYNNQSIIGWQTTKDNFNNYYGGNRRFSSGTISLGLNLFNGASRNRILNYQVQLQQNDLELYKIKREIQVQLELMMTHKKLAETYIDQYQKIIKQNNIKIIETANQQLFEGSIDYFDWALLINQSIQTELNYLNQIQEFNTNSIEIDRILAN